MKLVAAAHCILHRMQAAQASHLVETPAGISRSTRLHRYIRSGSVLQRFARQLPHLPAVACCVNALPVTPGSRPSAASVHRGGPGSALPAPVARRDLCPARLRPHALLLCPAGLRRGGAHPRLLCGRRGQGHLPQGALVAENQDFSQTVRVVALRSGEWCRPIMDRRRHLSPLTASQEDD